jgi:hypothetical protein
MKRGAAIDVALHVDAEGMRPVGTEGRGRGWER